MPEAAPTDNPTTRPEGGLRRSLQILRRRKLVFLAALIIVPLVALGVSLSKENQYTATATLLFQGSSDSADAAAREAATNSELAGLPAIAEQTANEMGSRVTGHQVLQSVSVDAGNTIADVGKISATTPSPSWSARMANAYSRTFIKFKRRADQSQVQQGNRPGQTQPGGALPGRARRAARAGSSGQPRQTQGPASTADRQGRVGGTRSATIGPVVPEDATATSWCGILLGALLGFGLAALFERIDRRVRTVEELEELFESPVLAPGDPPQSKVGQSDPSDVLQAPEAEEFRILNGLCVIPMSTAHYGRSRG